MTNKNTEKCREQIGEQLCREQITVLLGTACMNFILVRYELELDGSLEFWVVGSGVDRGLTIFGQNSFSLPRSENQFYVQHAWIFTLVRYELELDRSLEFWIAHGSAFAFYIRVATYLRLRCSNKRWLLSALVLSLDMSWTDNNRRKVYFDHN